MNGERKPSSVARSRIIIDGDGDPMHLALRPHGRKRWTIVRTDDEYVVVRRLAGQAWLVVCHLAPTYKFDMVNRCGLRVVARALLTLHLERGAGSSMNASQRAPRRAEESMVVHFARKRWHFEPTPSGYMVFRRAGGIGGPTITQLVVCHLPCAHGFTAADRARLRAVAREVLMADAERDHGVGRA